MDTIITDLTALLRDTWDCDDTVTIAPHPDAPEITLTATISGDAVTSFYRGDLTYTFSLYEDVRDDHTELRIRLDALGASVHTTALVPELNKETFDYPDFAELMRDFLADRFESKRTLLRMRVRANRLQIKGSTSGLHESSTLVA